MGLIGDTISTSSPLAGEGRGGGLAPKAGGVPPRAERCSPPSSPSPLKGKGFLRRQPAELLRFTARSVVQANVDEGGAVMGHGIV